MPHRAAAAKRPPPPVPTAAAATVRRPNPIPARIPPSRPKRAKYAAPARPPRIAGGRMERGRQLRPAAPAARKTTESPRHWPTDWRAAGRKTENPPPGGRPMWPPIARARPKPTMPCRRPCGRSPPTRVRPPARTTASCLPPMRPTGRAAKSGPAPPTSRARPKPCRPDSKLPQRRQSSASSAGWGRQTRPSRCKPRPPPHPPPASKCAAASARRAKGAAGVSSASWPAGPPGRHAGRTR